MRSLTPRRRTSARQEASAPLKQYMSDQRSVSLQIILGGLMLRGLMLRGLILSGLIISPLTGCGDESSLGSASSLSAAERSAQDRAERTAKADRWRSVIPKLSDEEVIVARITFGEARGVAIEAASQFLEAFEPISDERRPDLEGELREGLKGTLTARRLTSQGEEGVLRQDRFIATGGLDAQKLTRGLRESFEAVPLLPFRMDAGAEVTFSRLFENQESADQASQLTPLHLPFTRDRALALPEGTVVQMPVEAQMSLNLNGKHLSRSWQNIRELAQLLKSSASGFTSAAAQGVLMMNGSFTITVTRHQEQRVRILVQRSQERRGGAGGEVGAEITFFPAATVDRVRSLLERLKKWGKRPTEHLRSWAERLRQLRRSVSVVLRPLLDDSKIESYPKEIREALAFAETQLDPALDLLESGEMTVEVASSWIEEQVESALGTIDNDSILGQVKRHSQRAFNARLAVELSVESSEQIGVLGDYILDLSTESGVVAFESILSGRAKWEGILAGRGGDLGLIDLTLVDGLVSDDVEGVRCLRRAELKTQKRRVNINIQSPLSSWHFATQRQTHDLEIEVDGRRERWVAEQWSVNRGLNVLGLDLDETLVSGQLAQVDEVLNAEDDHSGDDTRDEVSEPRRSDEEWTYWMSWSKQWPKRARTPVSEAFAEALNLSGSVGVSQGLPQHFFTEAEGDLTVQFTLVFYQGLLTDLMERVDPDLIWEAAAVMAERFERRGGLPYAPALSTPELSERATESCDIITARWGRRYCRIIYYDLIEPLLELRASSGSQVERRRAQRAWLASLYERRFILNPIGARVTARLLSELATLLGRQDEVSLRLRLQHPSSPEVSLDVNLEGGMTSTDDQPIHALEIAEWLGLGEGITYWP